MAEKRPEAFLDTHKLSEDQRIDVIGHAVTEHGKTVAVCVDDVVGKPERYIKKLKERFPGVVVLERVKGPVAGVVTIRVGPQ